MNEINFKAKFISPVYIQKFEGKSYKPCKASFVELEKGSKADLECLSQIANDWYESLAIHIFHGFNSRNVNNHNFYAITNQKRNFSNLNPDSILGIAEFEKRADKSVIHYLQTNPLYKFRKDNLLVKIINKVKSYFKPDIKYSPRMYKDVGKSLLNSIKSHNKNSDIKLDYLSGVRKFYLKNGFVDSETDSAQLLWHSDKK